MEVTPEQWDGLCTALEKICDRIEDLEQKVNEEIMGGIKSLYDDNCRHEDIEGLKTKYSGSYGPYAEDFGALSGGKDMWESLYEDIKDLSEEERDPKIIKIFDDFKARLDKIRGVKPEAAKIEMTSVAPAEAPEAPAEMSMDDMIKETVGKLKKNSKPMAMKE